MTITYEKSLKILQSNNKTRIDLGLDRIRQLLSIIGNPQDKLQCIHIAGTNGKGSVAAMLESILREGGYKTGLYSSPHIFEYTERIKITGKDIDKDIFARYISEINNVATEQQINVSEFELLTAVMFKYFADSDVDIVILETGLGGRLDATNVITKNICSIITHIDLDHTEYLGQSREDIAGEKAGIIKENCPVITSEGYEVIKDTADTLNSLLLLVPPCYDTKYLNALALKGTNQQENLGLVIATIEHLFKNIDSKIIIKGLSQVKHPCRFQYIKDKNLIIDAAHNPNGILSLKENLNLYFPNTKRRFVFGVLKTKDYKKMIDELFSFTEYVDDRPEIYFYYFNEKARTFEELQEECIYYSKEFKSIKDINFSDDVLTIICGSIYMISSIVDKNWI